MMTALLATRSLREQSHVDLKLMSEVRCRQSRAKQTVFAASANVPIPTITGTTGLTPGLELQGGINQHADPEGQHHESLKALFK